MGSNLLWTRLSFMLFLSILAHTMARPNPWFGELYENGFDKPQDSKNVETNIDIKRPNSRMIVESEVSSSGSRFWDDLAPIFPMMSQNLAPIFPRHFVQAFSGALRLCDILRWDVFVKLVYKFTSATLEQQYKATMRAGMFGGPKVSLVSKLESLFFQIKVLSRQILLILFICRFAESPCTR